MTAQPVTGEPLKLSLDDAIQRGLKNNLGLKEVVNEEKIYHAEVNEALQLFLPTITLTGDTGYYMHDLAALGFGPKTISEFASAVSWRQAARGAFADYARRSDRRADSLQRRFCFQGR